MAVSVGKAIAWARRQRGFNMTALAWKVGCDRSWISRIEDGLWSPKYEIIERIATACGMSVDEMLAGDFPKEMSAMPPDKRQQVLKVLKKHRIPKECLMRPEYMRLPPSDVMNSIAAILGKSVDSMLYGEELQEVPVADEVAVSA